MKKGQDSFHSMIIVLALICAGAGLALGATYQITRVEIEKQLERDRIAALRIVLPEAHEDGFREVTVHRCAFAADGRYYEAYDKAVADPSGKLVGYALEAAGKGYSSTMRITVGVDPEGEIIRGIKITFQQETPGLGANCEAVEPEGTLWDALMGKLKQTAQREPRFQAEFHEKRADSFRMVGNKYRVKVGDEHQEIDGMTGATITKNAIIGAVLDAVEEFKRKVVKGRFHDK